MHHRPTPLWTLRNSVRVCEHRCWHEPSGPPASLALISAPTNDTPSLPTPKNNVYVAFGRVSEMPEHTLGGSMIGELGRRTETEVGEPIALAIRRGRDVDRASGGRRQCVRLGVPAARPNLATPTPRTSSTAAHRRGRRGQTRDVV